MFPIINPTALAFTLFTTFGVLVHDTQLDRAALAAVVPVVSFASFAAFDSVMKSGDSHVHVERVHGPNTLATLRMSVPRIQPRDEDRRYIQSKKVYFGTGGASYLWPSV